MGSAVRFGLLLAAGVAVLVVYVRSGESLVVLALSLVTLLVVQMVWAREPWRIDGDRQAVRPAPGQGRDEVWRCGHDVTWDDRGILAVAVGDRLPQLTVWSRVDGITVGRHRSQVAGRGPLRRRGLHLDLYQPENHQAEQAGGNGVWLCLGPDQDPERTATELASTLRQVTARRWYPEPER